MTGTPDRITEVVAKAWLVCDPNRNCSDPDAADTGMGLEPGNEHAGKPRWHWFVPRAEALREYLHENGLVIRPREVIPVDRAGDRWNAPNQPGGIKTSTPEEDAAMRDKPDSPQIGVHTGN